jgi:hypothetical protein
MCLFTWLSSRKYGTVWYHPASSKLWYLTAFHLLSISGKIDWDALESARVLSQLCSACCVLGAGCGFCVTTHHLGYIEATKSLKYPYYLTRDTCPSRANSEIFVIAPSDGCPVTTNLLSLDASLVIPTRVLCFEVSELCRRTPVRPVLLTGQTGTHRSDLLSGTALGVPLNNGGTLT